jgi:hypothetical protein
VRNVGVLDPSTLSGKVFKYIRLKQRDISNAKKIYKPHNALKVIEYAKVQFEKLPKTPEAMNTPQWESLHQFLVLTTGKCGFEPDTSKASKAEQAGVGDYLQNIENFL